MNGRGGPTDVLPRVATAGEVKEEDQTARALLTEDGFDSDDFNKVSLQKWSMTPLGYYSAEGNITMCRYLIARGADCRQVDRFGYPPLYYAAGSGLLEILKLLCQDGGVHEAIRKVTRRGRFPLVIALYRGNFEVVQWLIRNGALSSSPHDAVDGGGIDDAIMRRDLCHIDMHWNYDKRLTVLAWAQTLVAVYANVHVFLTGTIVSTSSSSVCRPPKNPYATRSHKRRKVSTSPLVLFNGKSGILELIAHFVAGTPQQRHTLRQLVERLPAFIADVPFVDPPLEPT